MNRVVVVVLALAVALVVGKCWLGSPPRLPISTAPPGSEAERAGTPGLTGNAHKTPDGPDAPSQEPERLAEPPAAVAHPHVLFGLVTDAAGAPQRAAVVTASLYAEYGTPNEAWTTRSSDDGSWSLGIPTLPVAVHAEVGERATPQVLVRGVPADGEEGIRLVLRARGEHHVRVVSSESGQPVVGALVVQSSGAETLFPARASQRTDSEGMCRFLVPAGFSVVRHTGPLGQSVGARASVRAGSSTSTELRVITDCGAAQLRVLLDDRTARNPFDVAVVTSGSPAARVYARTRISGAQTIAIPLARQGELRVALSRTGFGANYKWANLEDALKGGEVVLDFRGAYDGSMMLLGADGDPVSGVLLTLRSRSSPLSASVHTGAEGVGAVVLPAGVYDVSAVGAPLGEVNLSHTSPTPQVLRLPDGVGVIEGTVDGPLLTDGQVQVHVLDSDSKANLRRERVRDRTWRVLVPGAAGTPVDVQLIVDGTSLVPPRRAAIGDRRVQLALDAHYERVEVSAVGAALRPFAGEIGLRGSGDAPITRLVGGERTKGFAFHHRWRLDDRETARFLVPRGAEYEVWFIPEDGSSAIKARDHLTATAENREFKAHFGQ